MSVFLRRLALFGVPLGVGILTILHPIISTDRAYQDLLPQIDLWMIVHMLQLPGFFLLSLVLYLLIKDNKTIVATVCKVALVVVALFYPALDSIMGLGGGILVKITADLPHDQQIVAARVVNLFFGSSLTYAIEIVGALSWEVAIITAAIVLCRPQKTWLTYGLGLLIILFGVGAFFNLFSALIWWLGMVVLALVFALFVEQPLPGCLLIIAGLSFGAGHIPPYGPLSMFCLLLTAIYFEFFKQKLVLPRVKEQLA